jgi:hypothetical protein
MSQDGTFHIESGTVRFWMLIDGETVGASVSQEALHYRYRPKATGEDPLETYRANQDDVQAAVRRRVLRGSLRPVMLRESDLRIAGT